MSETSNYIPGVCNINPMEIRKRRQLGQIGLFVTAIAVVIVLVLHLPWIARIIVFAPAFLAATGYLQARNKFCVGYAGSKKQHADDGDVIDVIDESALAADRKKARTMNLQAFLIALVVTVIVCVIPL